MKQIVCFLLGVACGKTDPYECLVETLMSDRYDAVEAALKNS